MSNNVDALDAWIRFTFVDLTTALEELYFAQEDRVVGRPSRPEKLHERSMLRLAAPRDRGGRHRAQRRASRAVPRSADRRPDLGRAGRLVIAGPHRPSPSPAA